jgi:hypothetical protein
MLETGILTTRSKGAGEAWTDTTGETVHLIRTQTSYWMRWTDCWRALVHRRPPVSLSSYGLCTGTSGDAEMQKTVARFLGPACRLTHTTSACPFRSVAPRNLIRNWTLGVRWRRVPKPLMKNLNRVATNST